MPTGAFFEREEIETRCAEWKVLVLGVDKRPPDIKHIRLLEEYYLSAISSDVPTSKRRVGGAKALPLNRRS